MDISVVIPVYKSENTIYSVSRKVVSILQASRISFEVILVDDGNQSKMWELLTNLHHEFPDRITIVRLMRNFGQHNATMCGLRQANGEFIVTMDDDGQHPPEEIPNLIRAIRETGNDVVYGVPRKRNHAAWRNLGSWVVVSFYKLAFRTHVTPSSFRIMRRQVVEAILCYDLNYTYIDGLLAWCTDRISQIEVQHKPREGGTSSYDIAKLFSLAMNLFTNFSLVPLQCVTALGFLSSLSGFILGMYYLLERLLGAIDVPGYASIIVTALILGGLQMLSLGIIGEYLGRVHLNINKRPQYRIRDVIVRNENGTDNSAKAEAYYRETTELRGSCGNK